MHYEYAIYQLTTTGTINAWVNNNASASTIASILATTPTYTFATKSYVDSETSTLKTYVDNADDTLKTYVKNNFVMRVPYSQASTLTTLMSLIVAITPSLGSSECKAIVELTSGKNYICGYSIVSQLTTIEIEEIGSGNRWFGTLSSPQVNNTSISDFISTSSSNSYYKPYATETYVNNHHDATKQDKLIAGANITISAGNVISATGGGSDFHYEVVEELPPEGEENVIYLVPKEGGLSPDVYNEYIWVADIWDYEFIGTTAVDLSNYYTKNASLLPTTSSTYDLGSTSNRFYNLYLGNGILSDNYFSKGGSNLLIYDSANSIIKCYKHFVPNATNTYDLGSSSLGWKDLYLTGVIDADTSLGIKISGSSKYLIGASVFRPITTNYADLGTSSYAWKDLYLSGSVNFANYQITESNSEVLIKKNNATQVEIAQDNIYLKHTKPLNNGTYDLGASTSKWRKLFLSGFLTNNNASYGLALPDTTSYTANQTIATTSDLPQVKRFI